MNRNRNGLAETAVAEIFGLPRRKEEPPADPDPANPIIPAPEGEDI